MAFNLTQTEAPERISRLKREAECAFPNDNPQDAFSKFINERGEYNIFFLDDNGRRCVWRENADHSIKWTLNQRLGDVTGSGGRQFKVPEKKRTMADVNRPKTWKVRELVQHRSAGGWNLPITHRRHFSKLPKELQHLIFRFALTAPESTSVMPLVVSSNWVTELRNPGFVIQHKSSYSSLPEQDSLYHTLSRVQRKDEDGPYTEICYVFRLPIDASFLRACKDFRSAGNAVLYSKNEFSFDMVNPYHHKSPPTMLGTFKHHEEWNPSPYRPFISPGDIRKALYNIKLRVPIKVLTNWVYYDHFLRWLYCIGPKNAALVKTLKFQGTAKLHECDRGERTFPCFSKPCDYSIVDSLRIYIPFIQKFCTGLKKLTLIVEEDNWAKKKPQYIIDDGFHADREATLRPLLEKEITRIDSLKELIVLGSRKETEQLDYAKPVAEFLTKREKEKEGIQIQKAKAWAEAKPFVPVGATAGKKECRLQSSVSKTSKSNINQMQHSGPNIDLRLGDTAKIQVRENAIGITPDIAAAERRDTEFCGRFKPMLDLRFGEAEKIEVAQSYFRMDKR